MGDQEKPEQGEKPELEDDPSRALAIQLKELQEGFRESKEDLRFTIGLATGTFMFSVAFIDQIASNPGFRWLLVLGWLALLISIITSLEIFRRFQSFIMSAKSIPKLGEVFEESMAAEKDILIRVLATLFAGKEEEGGQTVDELRDEFQKKFKGEKKVEEVYKFAIKRLSEEGSRLEGPEAELFKLPVEVLKLGKTLRIFYKAATPSKVFKSFRKEILVIHYLTPVPIYSFYAGVLFIALFAIFNLMC